MPSDGHRLGDLAEGGRPRRRPRARPSPRGPPRQPGAPPGGVRAVAPPASGCCRRPRSGHAPLAGDATRVATKPWSPSPWTVGGNAAPTSGRLCLRDSREQAVAARARRGCPDFGTGYEPIVFLGHATGGQPRRPEASTRGRWSRPGPRPWPHGPPVGGRRGEVTAKGHLVLERQWTPRRSRRRLASPSGRRVPRWTLAPALQALRDASEAGQAGQSWPALAARGQRRAIQPTHRLTRSS